MPEARPAHFEDVDAVIDLATISNNPSGKLFKKATRRIICESRVRTVRMAREPSARRYIVPSSCSIYSFPGRWRHRRRRQLDQSSDHLRARERDGRAGDATMLLTILPRTRSLILSALQVPMKGERQRCSSGHVEFECEILRSWALDAHRQCHIMTYKLLWRERYLERSAAQNILCIHGPWLHLNPSQGSRNK